MQRIMESDSSPGRELLDHALLKNLCCPETKQSLSSADPDLIARLNKAISAGTLTNRAGQIVNQPIEHGFIRADGRWLYPVRNWIPIMLIDQALPASP